MAKISTRFAIAVDPHPFTTRQHRRVCKHRRPSRSLPGRAGCEGGRVSV